MDKVERRFVYSVRDLTSPDREHQPSEKLNLEGEADEHTIIMELMGVIGEVYEYLGSEAPGYLKTECGCGGECSCGAHSN